MKHTILGGHNERQNIEIVNRILDILREMLPKEDPRKEFEEGIRLTVKWYLENEEWMKNLIRRL